MSTKNSLSVPEKILLDEGGGEEDGIVRNIIAKTRSNVFQNQVRIFKGRISQNQKRRKFRTRYTKKHRSNGVENH